MSQTETLMLVVLGFALASFLALVIGRVLWRVSRRLYRRQQDKLVPTVVAELRADRDRLRAELAMRSRRFEVRLDDMKAKLVEHMAEVMRHRNRIELMSQELTKRASVLNQREAESKGMREQLSPLEAELAARTQTIQALEEAIHGRDEDIARVTRELSETRAVLADRDRDLARLENAASGKQASLPMPFAPSPELLTVQERLQHRIQELTALSQEIASQREQFAEERDKFAALQQATATPTAPADDNSSETSEPRERIDAIDSQGQAIEEKLIAAERESAALVQELSSLDQAWSEKIDELDRSPPEPEVPSAANGNTSMPASTETPEAVEPRRAAGNVVSLAARIKALQREISR